MEQSSSSPDVVFEAYYCEHRATAYDVALRIVGNPSEAEDVTQQVFLKFWSNPGAFRGGNFAAWITTMARNSSIDLLRRRRALQLGPRTAHVFATARCAESVEDEVIRNMIVGRVWEAMQSLKPAELGLVLASFMSEESHDQIARSAALPLGTVKTRIRSGLRRMRQSVIGLI